MAHNRWAVKGTAFLEIMVLRPEWECGGLADARAGWRVRARCWRVRGCEGGGMTRLQADVCVHVHKARLGIWNALREGPDSQPADKEVTPDM
ncbi:hypothetical protein FIBSPDRAFT_859051 [Athelia psychrophila]|uniref:Uncharacterized protein n=1 Tax=Athelia psychrophila TaxID=1759441 RepID=A0A166LLW1_9AGAM|nr:hypothetical protein FIBSPDRAFT_859051 [Fibularhizoctonia sp. CBS 109695]